MILLVFGSSYTAYQEAPGIVPRYDSSGGNEVLANAAANTNFTEISFNSASDPDERGVVWVQPFDAVIKAFHARIRFNDIDRDVNIVLYDQNSNVLSVVSLEGDKCSSGITTRGFIDLPFPEVRLQEGKTYRLTIKPTTTNNITILDMPYTDAATRKAEFGFGYETVRTDGGLWTDDTTSGIELTPIVGRFGSNRRGF